MMDNAEKRLEYYAHRIFTANALTETEIAGLESMQHDEGSVDFRRVFAVLMEISQRYTEIERDLANAAGLSMDAMQVTT